jgi:hypothetical protein
MELFLFDLSVPALAGAVSENHVVLYKVSVLCRLGRFDYLLWSSVCGTLSTRVLSAYPRDFFCFSNRAISASVCLASESTAARSADNQRHMKNPVTLINVRNWAENKYLGGA